ncbi:response regulator transcription factor [Chitiniphilus eburneus]|uniref:Response regulator transcription factor n=1 Tax=Chitiniphilus eburneus TaxID=2571148 RepID=A0A4U0Q8N5_9NEIS|nr:response regulator transcription factor [Chitiniphilus eburneus]TJZ77629.1 response regulator transcription factor [Chitiniphilus eburneus]
MSESLRAGYATLVVDDLPAARQSMRGALLAVHPDCSVAEVRDCAEARQWLAQADACQVAVIDIGLPDDSGLTLIPAILGRFPHARVLISTIYDDDQHLFSAIAAGAQGYLLKGQTAEVLVRHLREIEDGMPPLSPTIARRILRHFREQPAPLPQLEDESASELTPRETEVLSFIGRGLRVGEAARLMGLTDNTVAGYIKVLYRKLNICSRAEAALEAARRGLV